MAQGNFSKVNIGVRRLIPAVTPPFRNFEFNGQQTYVVMASKGYDHAGVHYNAGQTIAFDIAGGTKYSNPRRLERDFNRGMLNPSS